MKTNRKSYLLIFVLVITMFFINTSIHGLANPIPIVVDSGSCTPAPYNSTPIRFKSESVMVTLSDIANVSATYTFENTANHSVNQTILLPFWRTPYNLSLTCDSLELNYSWSTYNVSEAEDIFNISSPHPLFIWNNISVVNFTLSFTSYEEKTIFANYTREYAFTNYTNSQFRYIAITGSKWGHPIENAVFEFKINKTYYREPLKWDYDVLNTTEYVIGYANFSNWVPNKDLVIGWGEYHGHWWLDPIFNVTLNVTNLTSYNITYFWNKISNVTYDNNTVIWKTSNPSTSIVIYRIGNSTQWYALQDLRLTTNHTIILANLKEGEYQFYVISTDAHNDTILDNNDGRYYTFVIYKSIPEEGEKKQDSKGFIPGFEATLTVIVLISICASLLKRRKK